MPQLIKTRTYSTQTITVRELRLKLLEFDQDMGVAYSWEGQVLPVDVTGIEVMGENENENVCGPVLLLVS